MSCNLNILQTIKTLIWQEFRSLKKLIIISSFWLLIAVSLESETAISTPVKNDEQKPTSPYIHYPAFEVEEGRMRIFHVALIVEDLNRSIDFYKQELGLKLIRSQQSQLWKMALMTTGEGEPILELQEYIGPEEDPPPDGFSHLGVFVKDLEKYYEASRAKGVPWSGAPANYGFPVPDMGFMTDPDGYRIEVMENPSSGCTSCHRAPHLP